MFRPGTGVFVFFNFILFERGNFSALFPEVKLPGLDNLPEPHTHLYTVVA